MANPEWRDAERTFPRPATELGRLVRRGRRRVGVAILGALGLAAAAVGVITLRAAQHEAQVVLRVSEGTISDGVEMPRRELRGYVESALLQREVLLDIIESEDLFESKRKIGEQFAIDALRQSIEIEIYGNYFATWRRVGPRSLRIRVTTRSGVRQEAVAVARALARMIESAEMAHRRWRFEESSEVSQSVVARAEQRFDARQRQFTEQLVELGGAESAGDRVHSGSLRLHLDHLAGAMEREQRNLRDAMLARQDLNFRRAAARERLGLMFTVVDEVIPPPPPASRWLAIAALGGLVFALGLPLAAIAAGAFDGRLHEKDDVARLGLPPLGHVPGFRGHQLGALRPRR